ncbi:MAG: membrane protein [Burkholderiaceae bacterium]
MQTPITDETIQKTKNVAFVVYVLYALSFLWGVTAIAGVIIAYVKRDDVRGTWLESHFGWQIRTFWWGLLWTVVGVVLVLAGVGFLILLAVWIWTIYRVVKGWLRLNDSLAIA